MTLSIFDFFSIGVGPSSSHTVGPMRAAYRFRQALLAQPWLNEHVTLTVTLYGSLAFTCSGHGTDKAVLAGLEGMQPETVDPDALVQRLTDIRLAKRLTIAPGFQIIFDQDQHLVCNVKDRMPGHSNACRFEAKGEAGQCLERLFYSVGGGFIEEDSDQAPKSLESLEKKSVPYPFDSGKSLLALCDKHDCSIADIMLKNEQFLHPNRAIYEDVLHIASVMDDCMQRGFVTSGTLPGGLRVKRRAPDLYKAIQDQASSRDNTMAWLNVFAMAVNEENAAGGRVVTAPTNGAAGVIPAVLAYYKRFRHEASEQGVVDFLLTAAAIGFLYKERASISGAEMGCQGEVGVASSMAAGALTAVLGGNLVQIENAAEIAMEHHLGMTCDPVAGLVQVPCIERNAMGAVKAVNASHLALSSVDSGIVSLDQVIATMYETGCHMHQMYKETSQGGLAVNVVEC